MEIDIGQIGFYHPKLRELCLDAEKMTGVKFKITSQLRVGDLGVHGQIPLRATDLRMRNKAVGLAIVDEINKRWIYDPLRPNKKCAILHGDGYNMHIHLQVHPNTERV